jgi:hypothetical protein
MLFKFIIGAAFTCLTYVSFNVSAGTVSVDWKTAGDNLITHDDVSGLQWLDLTETYGLTYDYVSGQLGAGGEFEGFRYATDAEVQNLWSNFGIDLSAGAPTSTSSLDSNVETAAGFLGNTWNMYAWWDYPFGASGITASVSGAGHTAMGAYQTDWGTTVYETVGAIIVGDALPNIQPYGSYLVLASPVPIPAAVWLFASGLLGLVSVARRKKS